MSSTSFVDLHNVNVPRNTGVEFRTEEPMGNRSFVINAHNTAQGY